MEGAEGGSVCATGGGAFDPDVDRWPNRLPKIDRPTPCLPFAMGAGP